MKTKQKKTVEPLYTLPGEDSLGVQARGYAHGLNVKSRILFEQLAPGEPLPMAFIDTFPVEPEVIEEMARGCALINLTGDSWRDSELNPDLKPVTNSPDLFCEHYVTGFKEGYRFGSYAHSHGYLELSYSLPDSDRRFELAYRFAWEKMYGEPEPTSDTLMSNALEELKAIYKQYQSLN